MADYGASPSDGGFVPDGSTLLGVDDSGMAHIQGPAGGYVAYPADALHPNDRAKLGLDAGAGPVDAGAPMSTPSMGESTGGPISSGSDLGQRVQGMTAALPAQTNQPQGPGLVSQAVTAAENFAGAHPAIAAATFPVTGVLGPAAAIASPSPDLKDKVDATQALPDGYRPPTPVMPGSREGGLNLTPPPVTPIKVPGTKDYSGVADAGFNAEGQAVQKGAEAEGASAQQKAANAASAAQAQADAIKAAQQQRQAVIDQYKQRMGEIEQAQAKLDATHEDPNHWWNTRDTGQKVAATLSQALAGFAAGFQGRAVGETPIDKMIAQDIDAQRQNYMRARDSISAKRTAYAQLREQGLNDVEANLTLKSQQYGASLKSLDAMVDKTYSGEQIKQRAAQLAAELQEKKAGVDAQLQQSAAATAHERVATAEAAQNMAMQQRQLAIQQQLLNGGGNDAVRAMVLDPKGERTVHIPGVGTLLATGPEGVKRVNMAYTGASAINGAAKEMQDIIKNNPVDVMRPGSEAYRSYALARERLVSAIMPSRGIVEQLPTTLADEYKQGVEPTVIGSPTALANSIEKMRRSALSDANNVIQTETGRRVFDPDAEDAKDSANASLQKKYGG